MYKTEIVISNIIFLNKKSDFDEMDTDLESAGFEDDKF